MTDSSANEILFKELQELINEYGKVLAEKYSKPTVSKYISVCNMLNEYLQEQELGGFEDILGTHCGSKFVQYFNNHTAEGHSANTIKNILKGFFSFVHQQHGITNNHLRKYFKI